mgnify:CR=1 FL=1|tara:strand:+ start:58 stop:252 length:195 start_codon:yes stop_codon:yes gene_type:complete
MPSRRPKYVISLQSTQGTSPKLSFKVTGHKAEKILDILQSDIEKDRKKKETTSITLDRFFKEDN